MFTALKGLIFITTSITVQPKFLSLNGNLSLRDNGLIVFVNFSFSSRCDLHDTYIFCGGERGGGNGLDYSYVVGPAHPENSRRQFALLSSFISSFPQKIRKNENCDQKY